MNTKELTVLAEKNRKRLVEVVYRAKAGHIGGDLSCLNVMTALYFHVMQGLNPQDPKAPAATASCCRRDTVWRRSM